MKWKSAGGIRNDQTCCLRVRLNLPVDVGCNESMTKS